MTTDIRPSPLPYEDRKTSASLIAHLIHTARREDVRLGAQDWRFLLYYDALPRDASVSIRVVEVPFLTEDDVPSKSTVYLNWTTPRSRGSASFERIDTALIKSLRAQTGLYFHDSDA